MADAQTPVLTDEQIDVIADAHRWDTREGRRAMLRSILAAQAPAQPAETGVCSRCKGSGEQKHMTRHLGPDDYEVDGPCDDCGGTGDAPSHRAVMQQALDAIAPRFRSGNAVPVDKAVVPAAEWHALVAALSATMEKS